MSELKDLEASFASNQRLWDAWTKVHAEGEFYDVAGFREDDCKRLRFCGAVAMCQAIQPLRVWRSGDDDRSSRHGVAKERGARPHGLYERSCVERRHVHGHDGVCVTTEIATPRLDAP